MDFQIRGCWGPRAVWEDVPGYAQEILTYIAHLATLDPPFGSIRVPYSAGWTEGDPPSERLVAIIDKSLTAVFDNHLATEPYRSILVNAGDNGANTDLTGDDAFFRNEKLVTSLMFDLARFWDAHDVSIGSGRMVGERYERVFWKRWTRPDSPIPAIQPIPPDYASAEPIDGGTLYTWPHWQPSLHIGR